MVKVHASHGAVHKAGPDRRRNRRFLPPECEPMLSRRLPGLLRVLGLRRDRNLAFEIADISETGIGLVTGTRLAIGAKVDVSVHVRLFRDSLHMSGTVCRCHEVRTHHGRFSVGVSFDRLSAVQAHKIGALRDCLVSPAHRRREQNKKDSSIEFGFLGRNR